MLLVDEPSVWREPCSIAMVFEIFEYLHNEGDKAIIIVWQNGANDTEFADIGYVPVGRQIAIAGPEEALLENPDTGPLLIRPAQSRSSCFR